MFVSRNNPLTFSIKLKSAGIIVTKSSIKFSIVTTEILEEMSIKDEVQQ